MKKLFTLFSICIIASILFASCGTHVTIQKRHYSKGYYISKGNIKSDGASIEDESNKSLIDNSKDFSSKISVQSNEDNSKINSLPELKEEETIKSNIVESNDKNSFTTKRSNEKSVIQDKKGFSKNFPSKFLPNKLKEKSFASKGMKDSSDGLSLFWIVILVILILWAIGYIGGSVGALINLLLLVALILLILWLLRVI